MMTVIRVVLTLGLQCTKGESIGLASEPGPSARRHCKRLVVYTAMGDLPENWQSPFLLNLLAGGIRWATGDANASVSPNLKQAAPGFAEIPPKPRKP